MREQAASHKADQMLTGEVDLDAEQAERTRLAPGPLRQRFQAGQLRPPWLTTSPFELSESDIDVKGTQAKKSPPPWTEEVHTDSSSDFELKPMSDSSSPLELAADEMPAVSSDDEVHLGEWTGGKGRSGISLQDPADSGIWLEPSRADFRRKRGANPVVISS